MRGQWRGWGRVGTVLQKEGTTARGPDTDNNQVSVNRSSTKWNLGTWGRSREGCERANRSHHGEPSRSLLLCLDFILRTTEIYRKVWAEDRPAVFLERFLEFSVWRTYGSWPGRKPGDLLVTSSKLRWWWVRGRFGVMDMDRRDWNQHILGDGVDGREEGPSEGAVDGEMALAWWVSWAEFPGNRLWVFSGNPPVGDWRRQD